MHILNVARYRKFGRFYSAVENLGLKLGLGAIQL